MVVVLEPKAIPSLRMTVDEFLEADLPEGFRYELVDGEVVMSPNPNLEHDFVVDAINSMLSAYRRRHKSMIRLLSLNARLAIPGEQRVRHPDFALYAPWKGTPRGGTGWKQLTPFLVIEVVSPGQGRRDYREKPSDYLKAGVGEYWIVDPLKEVVTVLRRGRGRWLQRSSRPGESFEPASLPGLRVEVDRILNPEP